MALTEDSETVEFIERFVGRPVQDTEGEFSILLPIIRVMEFWFLWPVWAKNRHAFSVSSALSYPFWLWVIPFSGSLGSCELSDRLAPSILHANQRQCHRWIVSLCSV